MPLFDFECDCGHKEVDFLYKDYQRAISAPPVCPVCDAQMSPQFPKPSRTPETMDSLPMTDPRYVELRQRQCGVEI